jgi:diacylglycerol kinase
VSSSIQQESKVIPISSRAPVVASPQRFKAQNFLQSVGFALSGIRKIFETERNFRIHLVIGALVVATALLLQVNILEWGILMLCMGLMIAVEALNTAIEYTVDLMTGGIYHEKAKFAKDAAAGACLITAFTVAVVGSCIFVPRLWLLLGRFLG